MPLLSGPNTTWLTKVETVIPSAKFPYSIGVKYFVNNLIPRKDPIIDTICPIIIHISSLDIFLILMGIIYLTFITYL